MSDNIVGVTIQVTVRGQTGKYPNERAEWNEDYEWFKDGSCAYEPTQ